MAGTGIAELDDSVKVKYMSDYLMAAAERAVWSQFVDWDVINEGQGGSSFNYVAYEAMDSDDAAAKLPEKDDIEATALTDSSISVTPYEYGRRVTLTSKLRFQSHVKTREATAKLVGNNMTDTVEKAIRRGIVGGDFYYRVNDRTARTELVAADVVSFTYLAQLVSMAQSMGIDPIGQEFVAVIHPALEPDIIGMTEVKGIVYKNPEPLYKGEIARLAGIRFIKSRFGKLYLGGGSVTAVQAATDLNGAVVAGATSIIVSTGTGLAAGDFITIGAGATQEQVQITDAAATPTLTIRGAGNAASNFGLRWAHADAEAVTEAHNVAAICLLGANSVKGIYGANTGKYGKSVIKVDIDSLNRQISLGWYWYGGIGIVPKYVLRGEASIVQHVFGGN